MIRHRLKAVGGFAAFAVAGALALAEPAAGDEVTGVAEQPIVIESSQGELVRLARPASNVFIADPEVADVQVKSPRLVYVFGKRPGVTTLYAVDGNEQVLARRRVSVSHNLSKLSDSLRDLLPDARLEARSVDGTIVLSGDVNTATDAEDARRLARRMVKEDAQVVSRISVHAPNQVQLRVKVAEVSRDVLKKFGVNWNSLFSPGNFLFGLFTGRAPFVLTGDLAGALIRDGEGAGSITAGYRGNTANVDAVLDALDDEGLVSILAEPNLTALSGEQATFLAGGEFPIIVPDGETRNTVEFKQFGVSLSFKPTLVGDNRISLKVAPEVSQLSQAGAVSANGFSIPALTTRRALTTVELGSGQSFVIAGLLQSNTNHDIQKFPGLGDIPVLGTLFRSTRFQRNETELVIIVTPYIVRPVSTRLALPTDGFTPPTDVDRILFGRSYAQQTGRGRSNAAGTTGQGLVGPAGFVLD